MFLDQIWLELNVSLHLNDLKKIQEEKLPCQFKYKYNKNLTEIYKD